MTMHTWMTLVSWAMKGLGFLGAMPALMSPMMFATERAIKKPSTWLLFASVASFPLVCWFGVDIGWDVFNAGDQRLGLKIACAPLVNLAVFALAMTWIGVVHKGDIG
jgi:hypothetical protein